ncbi:hypothetical protein [Vibrio sp. TRT 17S01]|uniref:hypothetical protein n=1 Tax=Vibrio sp. TRT 17S01 TaxID=3418505 RepID=UPI003CED2618
MNIDKPKTFVLSVAVLLIVIAGCKPQGLVLSDTSSPPKISDDIKDNDDTEETEAGTSEPPKEALQIEILDVSLLQGEVIEVRASLVSARASHSSKSIDYQNLKIKIDGIPVQGIPSGDVLVIPWEKVGAQTIEFSYGELVVSKQLNVIEKSMLNEGVSLIKLGENDERCLTLSESLDQVRVEVCDISNPKQQWRFKDSSSKYYIENVFLLESGADKTCLAKKGKNGPPFFLNCIASGSGDLTGFRLWQTPSLNQFDNTTELSHYYTSRLGGDNKYNRLMLENDNIVVKNVLDASDRTTWLIPNIEFADFRQRRVLGTKKILLIDTYYSENGPSSEAYAASVKETVLSQEPDANSLARGVTIASHGRLNLVGTFIPNIDVGPKPDVCTSSVVGLAKDAVKNLVDLNDFDYYFVNTQKVKCSWSGLAATPGKWTIANASGHKMQLWNHEFGHNLGGFHARSLESCSRDAGGIILDEQCEEKNQKDPSNTLNGGGVHLFPITYHAHTGWLDLSTELPRITKPGRYYLSSLWGDGLVQGYRLLRKDGSSIFVEYRKLQNQFEQWSEDDPYINGLIVRMAKSSGSTITSYIVDTKPLTTTIQDAPLSVGEYFVLPDIGLKVTFETATDDGALLNVEAY